MRNFWILFKVNVTNTLGLSKLKKKFAKSGRFLKIGIPLITILLSLILLAFVFFYVFLFSSVFIFSGEYEGMLVLGVVIGSLLCFITSLTKANSYLFEAKDYDLLLSLPVKPSAVIGSKLSNLFLLNYISFGAVYLPSCVYYAIFAGPPVYFYPLALIVLIIGPFLLVTISTFLSYLIGLVLSRFKYKNFVQTIFMVGFLVLIMYGSMSLNQTTDVEPDDLKEMAISLKNTLANIYYPAKWAVGGLTGNILEILIYLAISIIPFILFISIVSRNFLKASERAKVTYRDKNFKLKEQKTQKQFGSLLRREFKRYFSNYAVVMNTIVGPIMSTIFVAMMLFGSGSLGFTTGELGVDYVVLILIGLSIFMSGISPTTTSTISLEGKTFWILKSAPIKVSTVFISKIAVYLFLSVPFFIINTVLSAIVLPLNVLHIIFLLIIPTAYIILSSFIGLFFNLCFPKMDWDNPLKPVKQGLPVFLTLIVDWILIGILVVVFVLTMAFDFIISYIAVILVIIALAALFITLTFTVGKKRYQKIPA